MVDNFAGSTVVHAVGGFCAMALAVILGPRLGKYGPDGKTRAFPAHNIAFVVIGTFILLFGWMGFNPGSTLGATDLRISVIAVNTNLAAVSGSAAAMLFWTFVFGKPDISMACNGMLAGLVAITAPCAFVSANSAVIIGIEKDKPEIDVAPLLARLGGRLFGLAPSLLAAVSRRRMKAMEEALAKSRYGGLTR